MQDDRDLVADAAAAAVRNATPPFYSVAASINARYAAAQGYGFRIARLPAQPAGAGAPGCDDARPPGEACVCWQAAQRVWRSVKWCKVLVTFRLLADAEVASLYDWVVFIDSDAVLRDARLSLQRHFSRMPAHSPAFFLLDAPWSAGLNTGFFAVRVGVAGAQFLKTWWEERQPRWDRAVFHEQSTLQALRDSSEACAMRITVFEEEAFFLRSPEQLVWHLLEKDAAKMLAVRAENGWPVDAAAIAAELAAVRVVDADLATASLGIHVLRGAPNDKASQCAGLTGPH